MYLHVCSRVGGEWWKEMASPGRGACGGEHSNNLNGVRKSYGNQRDLDPSSLGSGVGVQLARKQREAQTNCASAGLGRGRRAVAGKKEAGAPWRPRRL